MGVANSETTEADTLAAAVRLIAEQHAHIDRLLGQDRPHRSSDRAAIRRSEELLMELLYETVARSSPEEHEHDEWCDDETHHRVEAYDMGWHDCLERLWDVIQEREDLWRMEEGR